MATSWERAARQAALASTLALAGVAAGQETVAAQAPSPIPISSCPYTIVAPGTYVLTQDLNCPAPAITVAPHVDNVRLVLAGRTLALLGPNDPDAFDQNGIVAAGTPEDPIAGLWVAGGTVTGFDDGVFVRNAPGARVAGVTAAGNQGRGIYVDESPGTWLVGNTATGSERGILVANCDGCWIAGNRATGNARRFSSDGIWLLRTTGARVEGNTATGNADDGIELVSDSTGNLIRGNAATDNLGGGIDVADRSTGNRLVGNTATGNDADGDGFDRDLDDRNITGRGCVNTWRANRFATDNEVGADAGPGAGCIQ